MPHSTTQRNTAHYELEVAVLFAFVLGLLVGAGAVILMAQFFSVAFCACPMVLSQYLAGHRCPMHGDDTQVYPYMQRGKYYTQERAHARW